MDKPRKVRIPRTRAQKGRTWAVVTLFAAMTFSIWANVRSGLFVADNVIVSVWPPIVAFLCSHLISYFSPRTKWTKGFIYGGFGFITASAMYGSGYHIVNYVSHSGQPVETAITYVFMTDAPMLLAAALLIDKVSTARNGQKVEEQPQAPIPTQTPAKKTTPAKKAQPATKPSQPTKRATPAKKTTAAKAIPTFIAPQEQSISMDTFEQDMLNA